MSPSRRLVAVALLATASAVFGWVWWLVAADPEIPFLTSRRPAEWIVYPSEPSGFLRPAVETETVFRSVRAIERRPSSAVLQVRAHRDGDVVINGVPVQLAPRPDENWKRPRRTEVASVLHGGANEIRVRVRSRFGPPALWLSLEGDGIAWHTDGSWDASLAGAPSLPARLATTPMDRWSADPGAAAGRPRVLDSARRSLPAWVAFAGVTAAVSFVVGRRRPAWLVTLPALCWAALMWHDARQESTQLFGFDVEGHLKYIAYVLRYARLPLADEGWEMYQPPLYYVMAAAVLRTFGYTTIEYETLRLLRWLNCVGGVVVLASLLGSLRLMFPDSPRRWVTGFCVGALLPVQLYMAQYVSNETWAAAWASAAFYVCLRIIRERQASFRSHLLLGGLLGAGMLTKFSLLIVVGVVVLVLAGRLAAKGERSFAVWLRGAGAVVLACAVVCGWHFVRVAWRFGSPLIGNWDPATGFAWWQDPGYHTAAYYESFGLSLVEPIFSSFHSFADGIFSTSWGDGLLGGSSDPAVRPPWNYDLMVSGYLLACVPTVAILTGTVVAARDVLRKPSAEWLLVLGLVGATGLAIFVMTLRLPFHSQAKAFYGLGVLVPVSLLSASGFDVLTRGSRALRIVLWLLWGTWTLNACASFWIRG